ncbi:hypothetical protein N9Q90_00645 [Gammaproteobacteria bacterium]|nr:hypothetical protein [Gammaproteobacteria bacterium]MDC0990785.1 hypothetical protein [Gammaproteobacteria bacterium]
MVFNADARPISYSGGTTIMYKSDTFNDSIYLHYSPTYKYSIGLERAKNKFYKNTENYFRFTYLVNRKNTDISQRNLYFQSGVLVDDADGFFYGMHGDWETRRWFSGFGYKDTKNTFGQDYTDQYIQLGVAPYVGDYGDLHTWIMIKTKKNSLTNTQSTYPELKFFKGSTLVKFGYSDKTEWDLHLMYRF